MSGRYTLIERLKAHSRDPLGSAIERDCREAAAEIDSLRSIRETLERENDGVRLELDLEITSRKAAESRLARAEAALETLKTEAAAQFKRDGEKLTEADRRAEGLKAAIIGLIGKDSPIEDLLFCEFPDDKSITITAPLGAFRAARSLSHGEDK